MPSRIIVGFLSIVIIAGIFVAGFDAYTYTARKLHFIDRPQVSARNIILEEHGHKDQIESDDKIKGETEELNRTNTLLDASPSFPKPGKILSDEIVTTSISQSASSSLINEGGINFSWKNNSWGVTIGNDKNSLIANYQSKWSALSLYSGGIDLRGYQSISLLIKQASSSTDEVTPIEHLDLAFYQKSLRLGSVHLFAYADKQSDYYHFSVPLNDMGLKANLVTSVILESDEATSLSISDMHFSSQIVESKKNIHEISNPQAVVSEVAPVFDEEKKLTVIPTHSQVVYFAGLQNGWTIGSRRSTYDEDNTEKSISGKAVKVSFDSLTSDVLFSNSSGFDTDGYSAIRLFVFGGVTDHEWQQLYVTCYDMYGNKLKTVDIARYSGSGKISMQVWNKFEIPLSELGAENTIIGSIDIENSSITQPGDSLWIDQIQFFQY